MPIWSNVKMYLYAAVTFIIGALGVWVKILAEQKKSLKKDNEAKEKELQQSEQHNVETQEARKEEQTQNVIGNEGEREKEQSSEKVDGIINQSETQDVKVTL